MCKKVRKKYLSCRKIFRTFLKCFYCNWWEGLPRMCWVVVIFFLFLGCCNLQAVPYYVIVLAVIDFTFLILIMWGTIVQPLNRRSLCNLKIPQVFAQPMRLKVFLVLFLIMICTLIDGQITNILSVILRIRKSIDSMMMAFGKFQFWKTMPNCDMNLRSARSLG